MAIQTEGARKAAFLVNEANGYRSRGEGTVTVPSGGLEAGTVLGVITSSGKYVRHAAGASDGSQNEAGILFGNLDIAGDADGTIILRDAEVSQDELTYEDGADAAQITTSNTALAALGIIVR